MFQPSHDHPYNNSISVDIDALNSKGFVLSQFAPVQAQEQQGKQQKQGGGITVQTGFHGFDLSGDNLSPPSPAT